MCGELSLVRPHNCLVSKEVATIRGAEDHGDGIRLYCTGQEVSRGNSWFFSSYVT